MTVSLEKTYVRQVYHVYAGDRDPFCQGLNTETDSRAAAKGLFTRYKNRGWAYTEMALRWWVVKDEFGHCNEGCCGAHLISLQYHGERYTR